MPRPTLPTTASRATSDSARTRYYSLVEHVCGPEGSAHQPCFILLSERESVGYCDGGVVVWALWLDEDHHGSFNFVLARTIISTAKFGRYPPAHNSIRVRDACSSVDR